MINSIDANGVMVPPAVNINASGLKLRALSAAVLIPIVLVFLYLGGLSFALFLTLLAFLMAREWDMLTGSEVFGPPGFILASGLVLVLILAYLSRIDLALLALLLIGMSLALMCQIRRQNMVWPIIGLFWLGLPCLGMMWLRMSEQGLLMILWLFVLVWSCDTGAYFAGRRIRGPKLAPRISPNKTWAGLLGGMLAAAGASSLLAVISELGSALLIALLGAILAFVSQCGDLAESGVKRRFNVKNSGALIPGHGGVLDRIDGLLFAAPALVLILVIHELGYLPW